MNTHVAVKAPAEFDMIAALAGIPSFPAVPMLLGQQVETCPEGHPFHIVETTTGEGEHQLWVAEVYPDRTDEASGLTLAQATVRVTVEEATMLIGEFKPRKEEIAALEALYDLDPE